jgi:hypothetical protein
LADQFHGVGLAALSRLQDDGAGAGRRQGADVRRRPGGVEADHVCHSSSRPASSEARAMSRSRSGGTCGQHTAPSVVMVTIIAHAGST